MFSHIMIGTNDLDKAKAFYDNLLSTLEVRPAKVDGYRIFYFTKTGVFSVTKPINGEPATFGNGTMLTLAAPNRATVDRLHAAALANGGSDEGAPGERANGYYVAYWRDPDGNKMNAVALS